MESNTNEKVVASLVDDSARIAAAWEFDLPDEVKIIHKYTLFGISLDFRLTCFLQNDSYPTFASSWSRTTKSLVYVLTSYTM
jgi:hypothetical protein